MGEENDRVRPGHVLEVKITSLTFMVLIEKQMMMKVL